MTKTEENQNSAATPAATAAPVPGVVDLSIETSKLRLFPQLGTVRDPVTGKPVPTFWQVLKSVSIGAPGFKIFFLKKLTLCFNE